MPEAKTCLGFAVDCATLWKGAGVVLAGVVLFIGSVYVLLAAVFGRWMGYLVLMVALSGWLIIHSSLWFFGYWSQGPETPTNLGPRGSEPAWLVVGAGLQPGDHFQQFQSYPGDPWQVPTGATPDEAADIQSVNATATTYLAEQANAELGKDPLAVDAVQATQFTVDSITFATAEDGHTPLAVVKAHFNGGGPETTLSMYHDSGSVPRYSIMFLAGAILLFLIHLPLLDRAERQRKAFLTGGSAPAWYGPA
jgi:hypothetical protein